MIESVCVFCGSRDGANPAFRGAAEGLGRALAEARLTLVYGGGEIGLMGACADAVLDGGGIVRGLIPEALLSREIGHRRATELVVTGDMFERKSRMIAESDAFVILPGGLGTLDELFEVVTLRQLRYHDKPVILVNAGGFWDPFMALVDRVIGEGFAEPSAARLFAVVDGVDEVVPALRAAGGRFRPAGDERA